MTTAARKYDPRELYEIYRVQIRLRDRLFGGAPRNKELIQEWVKARTGFNDDLTQAQTQEALDLVVNDVAEKTWVGFQEDKDGLLIRANNIKAMLKQAASMLRITKDKIGSKQILAEGCEVKALDGSDRIRFAKTQADGTDERPIHVMTAQGPRTALKRIDYVNNVSLSFEIWVLKTSPQEKRHVGQEDLVLMLTFSQENGLGADRSQGGGKFDIVEFQKVK